ncbi:ferric-chelate reductase 1 [Plakobranchus ocellatus]|uniref:Ferric-chelate reductase 1 n=1 Tax=Plakobranchus ocellatus TaxID=259542 RepID=A0AAV4CZ10_9GAST|nr:ferric-chelate reductase 1 [Plakobranchus ocellatus]
MLQQKIILTLTLLCVWCPSRIKAYSAGASEIACNSFVPGHNVALQTSDPPYSITLSTLTISPGSEVRVTISGREQFKGFLIRAKAGNTYILGQFTDIGGQQYRCHKSGVTHRGPSLKSSVNLTFRFPKTLRVGTKNLVFLVTIVKEKVLIWKFTSPVLTVVHSTASPPQTAGDTSFQPTPTSSPGNANGDKDDKVVDDDVVDDHGDDDDDDDDGGGDGDGDGDDNAVNDDSRGSGIELQATANFRMLQQKIILTLTLLCVWCPSRIKAYSAGGPEIACNSLVPGHSVAFQTSDPPYTITPSTLTISPGSEVRATISGSEQFKGFMIRVRAGNTFILGQFTDNGGNQYRCQKSGVTHRGSSLKSSVNVTFRFPNTLRVGTSNLVFIATVVKEYSRIWQFTSSDLTVVPSSTSPPQTAGDTSSQPTPISSPGDANDDKDDNAVDNDDDDDGGGDDNAVNDDSRDSGIELQNPGYVSVDQECGRTRGCFHNCDGDGAACSFLLSWQYQSDQDSVLFNFLFQTNSKTDQWIALGFSNDVIMVKRDLNI